MLRTGLGNSTNRGRPRNEIPYTHVAKMRVSSAASPLAWKCQRLQIENADARAATCRVTSSCGWRCHEPTTAVDVAMYDPSNRAPGVVAAGVHPRLSASVSIASAIPSADNSMAVLALDGRRHPLRRYRTDRRPRWHVTPTELILTFPQRQAPYVPPTPPCLLDALTRRKSHCVVFGRAGAACEPTIRCRVSSVSPQPGKSYGMPQSESLGSVPLLPAQAGDWRTVAFQQRATHSICLQTT